MSSKKAILHFEKALKIKPDYAIVHNNLGIALIQIGEIEKAIKHFKTALRIKPDFTPAQENLEILQKQQEEQKGSNY